MTEAIAAPEPSPQTESTPPRRPWLANYPFLRGFAHYVYRVVRWTIGAYLYYRIFSWLLTRYGAALDHFFTVHAPHKPVSGMLHTAIWFGVFWDVPVTLIKHMIATTRAKGRELIASAERKIAEKASKAASPTPQE